MLCSIATRKKPSSPLAGSIIQFHTIYNKVYRLIFSATTVQKKSNYEIDKNNEKVINFHLIVKDVN